VAYRYKKDMALGVERQAELERGRAQLELDWQRRYEELERLQYAQSEELVKTLSTARNEVTFVVVSIHCDGDGIEFQ